MNIGVDKGTVYTKTVNLTLPSVIRELKTDMDVLGLRSKGQKITLNGRRYLIGERGDFATDLSKSTQESTRNLVYSAIAMTLPANDSVNLVVGLPVAQYTKQKDAMKKLLTSLEPIVSTVDGRVREFTVDRVEVFPEGAGAYYSDTSSFYQDKNVLVVDVGGLSVDNVVFENGQMGKYSTYAMGVMKLYQTMVAEINRVHDTNYGVWDVDSILSKGLFIEGERQSLDILHPIIEEHVDNIHRQLRLEYDLRAMESVLLAGGGGRILFDQFKSRIPHLTLMDKPHLANVIGFQRIAEAVYANS